MTGLPKKILRLPILKIPSLIKPIYKDEVVTKAYRVSRVNTYLVANETYKQGANGKKPRFLTLEIRRRESQHPNTLSLEGPLSSSNSMLDSTPKWKTLLFSPNTPSSKSIHKSLERLNASFFLEECLKDSLVNTLEERPMLGGRGLNSPRPPLQSPAFSPVLLLS